MLDFVFLLTHNLVVSMVSVGIPGAICTPKCSDFMPCPKDVPYGVTAQPTCALKDQSGNEYCVLLCKPGDLRGANECGDATCQPIQGLGICTFDA